MAALDNPALTVVVAIVSDTTSRPNATHLEPCLAALRHQSGAGAVEIVVPHLPSVEGIAQLRRQYPDVRFLETPDLHHYTADGGSHDHHDELRARGVAAARGRIVAVTEDHGIPARDFCARVIEGHERPVAALGGAIENGVDRPLNWAVYFCDFLRYQRPFPEGETTAASDANASYRRSALEAIRPVWQDGFDEISVNAALRLWGGKLVAAPDVVIYQHRQGLRLIPAMKERFIWGRSYGAKRIRASGMPRRLYWTVLAPLLPGLLVVRMTLMAWKKRRTMKAFLKALPLTMGLAVSWSCGEFTGYVTGRTTSAGAGARLSP
jgi:hypothetical protein